LSVNNVLLNRFDDASEPLGLLIDFDYSIEVKQQGTDSADHISGRDATDVSVPAGADAVRTVCLIHIPGMSTNHVVSGHTTVYGY
jgi:hypothetical protein